MVDLRTYSRRSYEMVRESLRASQHGLPPGPLGIAQLMEFVGVEGSRRELGAAQPGGTTEPPIATAEGTARESRKRTEPEGPVSFTGSVEHRENARDSYDTHMRAALPTGRRRPRAFAAAQGQPHVPALGLRLVVDNTGHAAFRSNTGTSMRSRNS